MPAFRLFVRNIKRSQKENEKIDRQFSELPLDDSKNELLMQLLKNRQKNITHEKYTCLPLPSF